MARSGDSALVNEISAAQEALGSDTKKCTVRMDCAFWRLAETQSAAARPPNNAGGADRRARFCGSNRTVFSLLLAAVVQVGTFVTPTVHVGGGEGCPQLSARHPAQKLVSGRSNQTVRRGGHLRRGVGHGCEGGWTMGSRPDAWADTRAEGGFVAPAAQTERVGLADYSARQKATVLPPPPLHAGGGHAVSERIETAWAAIDMAR